MAIQATCDKCHTALRIKDELAGKRVKCPRCQQVVAIPGPQTPARSQPTIPKGKSVPAETEPDSAGTSRVARARRNVSKWWWIAGGAALLLAGAALAFVFWPKDESTPNPKGDGKQGLKIVHGSREINIESVVVGLHSEPIPDAPGLTWTSKEKFLIVHIETYNRGDRGHFSFQDWRLSSATLRDNAGKTYKKWSSPFGVVEPNRSIGPGDGLIIPIAFHDPPAPNIEHVDLELPEGLSDPNARMRFRIPKDMIQFK